MSLVSDVVGFRAISVYVLLPGFVIMSGSFSWQRLPVKLAVHLQIQNDNSKSIQSTVVPCTGYYNVPTIMENNLASVNYALAIIRHSFVVCRY